MKKYKQALLLLSFVAAFAGGSVTPGVQDQESSNPGLAGVMPCEEDCVASIYNGVLHCKPGGEWMCSYKNP